MIIMGIDPGTRFTGVGIIEVNGDGRHAGMNVVHASVIKLPEPAELATRLVALKYKLHDLYQMYCPHHSVVEKIFFARNAESAFKLGHARGVCLMMAADQQSVIAEYAAKFVKKSITGSGAASKEQVRLHIQHQLRYNPSSNEYDITDAIALAVCHARQLDANAIVSQGKPI